METELIFPLIDKELIESLKRAFPNTLPRGRMLSDHEQGVIAGTQDVIERLNAEYVIQQEEATQNTQQN